MKQVGVVFFVMMVLAILGYLWHALHEFHAQRYGRCWSLIGRAIDDLFDQLNDDRHHSVIRDQSKKDIVSLKSFIEEYKGTYDLDRVSPDFDPEHYFFKELKSAIAQNWHFKESYLVSIIDQAIYAYNCDVEYHITPREFVDYVTHQFEYHFLSKM